MRWRSVAAVAAGYLIGSIPVGLWLGRLRGVDVRDHGSGATGATNVLRTLGPAAGVMTFGLDAVKGAASVVLARSLCSDGVTEAAAGIAAVAGHSWPVWAGYRGGKGVATATGGLLTLSPPVALGALAAGGATVGLTKTASAGSLAATLAADALAGVLVGRPKGRAVLAFTTLATGIIFIRHRENIGRLIRGSEPTLGRKPEMPVANM